ncbi:endolytic transglycosylase MltG [Tepidibacillus sp. LV47]|uniref:endolytic transglycosylase MltG n=1 Tax=Tepidibacillus sp. LV47 TaxID=3398228 RepID=UPI003AABB9E7
MVFEQKRKWILSISGIVIIFLLFSAGFVYSQFQPVDSTAKQLVKVNIPPGSSTAKIASLLKKQQLIKSEWAFKLYLKYKGDASKLQAGAYEFSKQMRLSEIVKKMVSGNVVYDTVRFTIPEGYTVVQIADKLSKEGIVNKERFLQLAKEGNFNYDFIKAIPKDPNIQYRLEGYLFPDTYEVKKGATEEEIIHMMLRQFQKEWDPRWNNILKEKNMTIHQVVTIASIVEREVVVPKERPIVAGVFYNRLNHQWKLQSCATVQFVLGKQKERLTFTDLAIKNPYNTYVNEGLPPGAIGNPGREALKAAIYPAKHDYFFFVTKKDGSGEHYFSKTYAEHQKYDSDSRLSLKGNW